MNQSFLVLFQCSIWYVPGDSSEDISGEQKEGKPKAEEHGNEADVLPQRSNAKCCALTMNNTSVSDQYLQEEERDHEPGYQVNSEGAIQLIDVRAIRSDNSSTREEDKCIGDPESSIGGES